MIAGAAGIVEDFGPSMKKPWRARFGIIISRGHEADFTIADFVRTCARQPVSSGRWCLKRNARGWSNVFGALDGIALPTHNRVRTHPPLSMQWPPACTMR
jgi:hypothetical protein